MANVKSISKSSTDLAVLASSVHPTITVAQLSQQLNTMFAERTSVIAAVLAAAVAGQHAVLFGDPGTAKSDLARMLRSAFDASYFELLMTRFTTPDEVFGPVKLSALQADRFARALHGYMATSEVVFLDEIFKANSAILNALLTILNERKIHDDGAPVDVPLVTCIAASNELPEGPELAALYDRFLVRGVTEYISDRDAFDSMVANAAAGKKKEIVGRIDIRAEQAAARAVVVSPETLTALGDLRYACRNAGIKVSDRRWIQCLSLVRAVAHIDGRKTTEPDDLEILENVLWQKPDERTNVARVIQQTVSPEGTKAVAELDAAREIVKRLPSAKSPDEMALLGAANKDLANIIARLGALPAGKKVNAARSEVAAIKVKVAKLAAKSMGLDV